MSGPRLLFGLAAIIVLIVAGVSGYLVTRSDDEEPADYVGAVINEPVPMPDAVLTDDDGKPFDLRTETDGFVTLLYVGYTHCPDICPTHLYEMSEAIKRLPEKTAEQVKVVFVTADPERDTPEVMKAYVDTFDPNFIGLTGTREETDAFQETLGIPVATRTDLGGGNYAVNHAAYVIAFTKDQVAYTVYPSGMGMKEWLNDLPLLVSKGYVP
jgi:protein SCO1/2